MPPLPWFRKAAAEGRQRRDAAWGSGPAPVGLMPARARTRGGPQRQPVRAHLVLGGGADTWGWLAARRAAMARVAGLERPQAGWQGRAQARPGRPTMCPRARPYDGPVQPRARRLARVAWAQACARVCALMRVCVCGPLHRDNARRGAQWQRPRRVHSAARAAASQRRPPAAQCRARAPTAQCRFTSPRRAGTGNLHRAQRRGPASLAAALAPGAAHGPRRPANQRGWRQSLLGGQRTR